MKKDSTRIRILLAAEREFALKGIDGARVSSIVEAAGSSNTAAINYYFRSKNKLLAACLTYRTQALNSFQEKLYIRLISESKNNELELLQYYLLLVAPTIAAIKHCLPNAYYSRFMANYYLYAEANPQAPRPTVAPIEEICIRNAKKKIHSLVGEHKANILATLHRNHLTQGVARLEAYVINQQTVESLSTADTWALMDELTLELIQHAAFLAVKEKALRLNTIDQSLVTFQALCTELLPLELDIEA
jgi:AcrR family transcriptional regulator